MNTAQKLKWAILVTGWGRNARDIIEAFQEGIFQRSSIDLLLWESEPCGAFEAA